MRRLAQNAFQPRRTRAGNVMVEFAIAFSVLFSVFAGTFQFGWTFYQYDVLASAVDHGARYASLRPYDAPTATPSRAFLTAVQNMVVYGDPAGGSRPVVRGLTPAKVNLAVTFTNGIPSAVTVCVSGYTINSVFSQVTLPNKPKVTYAYQGIYSPF